MALKFLCSIIANDLGKLRWCPSVDAVPSGRRATKNERTLLAKMLR
jgi:hypothetical protein